MKYLKQLAIILAVSCAGEVLNALIPLPVPAGIYGMVLMLVLLLTGALKLPAVEESADFLVAIMPVMFIPAAAGLWDARGDIASFLIPCILAVVVLTPLVMGASGSVTQAILRREGKKK